MYIYLNQQLVPDSEAVISIYEHGFLYGVGLFETFRTYQGHPFLLRDHLERLEKGCRQVGMSWEADVRRITEQVRALLGANGLEDAYFRLNVSAGAYGVGLPNTAYSDVTEALLVKELPQAAPDKRLSTVPISRNTPEGQERLKSHHYLNNLLAKQMAPPDTEGVFLTAQGKVAEGIVSNLFFVRGQRIFTPALSTGILNGITRQWVLHIASQLGFEVQQGEYELSYAKEADEVFVTNSIQEIVPVYRWDEQDYPPIDSKSITLELKQVYDQCKYTLTHTQEWSGIDCGRRWST